MKNVQYANFGGSYTLTYIYENSWNCTPKRVNLTLCKLFFSESNV